LKNSYAASTFAVAIDWGCDCGKTLNAMPRNLPLSATMLEIGRKPSKSELNGVLCVGSDGKRDWDSASSALAGVLAL
jgi:hypothetical protein